MEIWLPKVILAAAVIVSLFCVSVWSAAVLWWVCRPRYDRDREDD